MSKRPLRILHCAMFSVNKYGANYYHTPLRLSGGLIRNGHFVYNFSYRDVARDEALLGIKKLGLKKMRRRFVETAERIDADLVLLGHAELIDTETLRELKRRLPNCKIAMWWVDWWRNLVKYDAVMKDRMPLLDAVFMTTDPDFARQKYPPLRERDKFFFMPNSCDPSMDTGNAYALGEHKHDVVFIGRSYGGRDDFLTHIKQNMSDLNIGVYGQQRKDFVLGRAYLDLISNCRIGINYQRDNAMPLSSSNRMIHLAANGCLVMSSKIPRIEEIFSTEEVVYFDTPADCEEKIRHFLNHPEEARKIAEAAQMRAHKEYDNKIISADMMEKIFA